MQDPMDWLWDRGLKKKEQEILNESGDQLGLHGKVVPVKTKDFDGHAHISFDRVKRGKHQQHSYKVDYKGTHEGEAHHSTTYMSVDHNNGRPYKFRDHPHSSKDLHTLLHKAAPRWVRLSDLQPRPSNESLDESISHTVYFAGGDRNKIADHLEKNGHDVAEVRPGRIYVRSKSQIHLSKSLQAARKAGLAIKFSHEDGFRY